MFATRNRDHEAYNYDSGRFLLCLEVYEICTIQVVENLTVKFENKYYTYDASGVCNGSLVRLEVCRKAKYFADLLYKMEPLDFVLSHIDFSGNSQT